MAFPDSIPFLGRKSKTIPVEPYGGGIRPPVVGPTKIKRRLGRLSTLRTALTAALFTVTALNIGLSFLLFNQMNTKLYIADGSPFGCVVEQAPIQ